MRTGAHLSIEAMVTPSVPSWGSEVSDGADGMSQVRATGGLTGLSMNRVPAYELVVSGSHGMAARAYPAMMDMAAAGILRPDLLITRTVGLGRGGSGGGS
ncbi:hypothetical protein [Streptomyces xantholiticus]|uniref:hypothetical protein n=1 Tax=Streptomyces xantholiticus TaxID=68285 RepID=UPI001671F95C|nr:hypothetical protein [Streptomyces xantholiticus]GGW62299.1 hypothetical protein GCM10010381_54270 [Streptomyces xantholiticus]